MNIALVDVDGHNFPNLALMKIAAWHKANGDSVEWYDPLFSHPDRIYASKVFTFTPDYPYFPTDCDVQKGGTGYDVTMKLPDEIERMTPDYTIYPQYGFAVGFLTRGCCNNCPWCVVPKKEGRIHIVSDFREIAKACRKIIKLLDNNFLAADEGFVEEQLATMAGGAWRIDFNQALDCRRVNKGNAKLLSKVKWEKYIRFSCDTDAAFEPLQDAVRMLRDAGYYGEIFCYVLSKDVGNSLARIRKIERLGVTPFCMPWRDLGSSSYTIPKELGQLARWCNRQWIRKSVKFSEYKKRS